MKEYTFSKDSLIYRLASVYGFLHYDTISMNYDNMSDVNKTELDFCTYLMHVTLGFIATSVIALLGAAVLFGIFDGVMFLWMYFYVVEQSMYFDPVPTSALGLFAIGIGSLLVVIFSLRYFFRAFWWIFDKLPNSKNVFSESTTSFFVALADKFKNKVCAKVRIK